MEITVLADAHRRVLEGILKEADNIEQELLGAATELSERTNSTINLAMRDKNGKREKPPAALVVRPVTGAFGPKLVWITYTSRKFTLKAGGSELRFTREIGGRSGGRYPARTFSIFPAEMRAQVLEFEQEAAKLRALIVHYRALVKWASAANEIVKNAQVR